MVMVQTVPSDVGFMAVNNETCKLGLWKLLRIQMKNMYIVCADKYTVLKR
jgi:hypothetical protein